MGGSMGKLKAGGGRGSCVLCSETEGAEGAVGAVELLCLVARVSDFGKNDTKFSIRTHLGHLLNPGDYALGYDLYGANNNDIELEKYKGLVLPYAILIKKSFEEKRRKQHGKPHSWKLKSLDMEVDDKGKLEMNSEYEQFLKDLEENPDLRFNISLY